MQALASQVPTLRVGVRTDLAVKPDGAYVLYWMTMFRRRRCNFALQRAVDWARALDRPLLVLEALRCGYPYASDRLHAFVLEGMADNERAFADGAASYVAYVEPAVDAGKHLLKTLAGDACVVVGDDFPSFMLPRMVAAAARQMPVRFEVVDSNGLLPMRAAPKEYLSAFDFRRFLQKELPAHLAAYPKLDPLEGATLPRLADLPPAMKPWPPATRDLLEAQPAALARLPIDHGIGHAVLRGGAEAASARLDAFVRTMLDRYPERRNEPGTDGTSRFSPYLHFGHLSVHEVLAAIARHERWSPERLAKSTNGAKAGWWRTSPGAESFLDEIVTWRELGYNLCAQRPHDHDRYEALPEWARRTLDAHAGDPRPHRYSLEQLEAGRTHDPVWNAAHGQLLRDGWFHNRMRMLWAKKILEWSPSPRDALRAMTVLMNKYSLDGRNPNSYSGYLWTLGRYDRPWGPERPVFGKVRYMSSEQTARKADLKDYLERYQPEASER